MPWQFADEEELLETDSADTKGWRFSDEAGEQETSLMRAAGGAGLGLLGGIADMAIGAFGGGPQSAMGQEQQLLSRMYEPQKEFLQSEGYSEEEISEMLGKKPPMPGGMGDVLDIATSGRFIPQTPEERVAREMGREAGEWGAMSALLPGSPALKGIAKEAGLGGLFGLGASLAEEDEQGPMGQMAQGVLFAATPFLLKKGKNAISNAIEFGKGILNAKGVPSGTPKFLEEVSMRGVADLELSSKDLVGRVAKTSEEMLTRADEIAVKAGKPTMENIGPFRAGDIEKELIESNQKALLDRISPAGETKKANWESVNKVVEHNFEAAKESYDKLYRGVEANIEGLQVVPEATYKAARPIYEELQKTLIKAPEEGGVKAAIETLVNTLSPMKEGALVEMPADRIWAAKRSINRLLAKSDIIPAPVDLLKTVNHGLNQDLLRAMEKRPAVKQMFEAAENQFKEVQNVFNNDVMVKARKTANPEDLGNYFSKPSNLEKLKTAIGKDKKVEDFIDRLVVENISKKSREAAAEMANETRQYMGEKARKTMDKVLEYGDKMSAPGQQAMARGRVLEDLQKMADVGMRPEYTLKLMQNKVGRELVNNTLKRSPQGRKMLRQLHKMQINDMMKSVTKDGVIDFEKAKDIIKDPDIKALIKDAAGEEGVKFFEQMQTYGRNMAENIRRLKSHEPGFFETVLEKFFTKEMKWMLYGLAHATGGKALLAVLGLEGAKLVKRNQLHRVVNSTEGRNLIKSMGRKNLKPSEMRSAMKRFAQVSRRMIDSDEGD